MQRRCNEMRGDTRRCEVIRGDTGRYEADTGACRLGSYFLYGGTSRTLGLGVGYDT